MVKDVKISQNKCMVKDVQMRYDRSICLVLGVV